MSNHKKPFVVYINSYGERCTAFDVAHLINEWETKKTAQELVVWTWDTRKQGKGSRVGRITKDGFVAA